jgi:hypothetical protein
VGANENGAGGEREREKESYVFPFAVPRRSSSTAGAVIAVAVAAVFFSSISFFDGTPYPSIFFSLYAAAFCIFFLSRSRLLKWQRGE